MASLAGLARSAAAGDVRILFRVPPGRIKIDRRRLEQKFKAGRSKALDRAGSLVRQSAKKQFSQRRPLTRPVWKRVGEHKGLPLVSMSFQNTAPGKVTSWRPKRFLYSKIFYARDERKGSVVIGPDKKVVDINTLHEYGGSREVKLVLVRPVPVTRLFQYQVPGSLTQRTRDTRGRFQKQYAYVGMWHSTGSRVRGQVVRRDPGRAPAGRYMENGLKRVRPKIVQQFRDQIRGP